MMQPSKDLVSVVLRDEYGSSLDWEIWRTPRCGDSAFMSSVRTCLPKVQRFFPLELGAGETSQFRDDYWWGHDRLCGLFPCFYALSTDPRVSMRRAWHDAWVPAMLEALPN